jgi:hypothetical protein
MAAGGKTWAIVLLALVSASRAAAADITWAAPTDESGRAADVVSDGVLVTAVTAGPTARVKGVKFTGQTALSNATLRFGVADGYEQYGAAPGGWDIGYRGLVAGGAYAVAVADRHQHHRPDPGPPLRGADFRAVLEQQLGDHLHRRREHLRGSGPASGTG